MAQSHPVIKKWFAIFLVFVLIGIIGGGASLGALLGYINSLPPLSLGDLDFVQVDHGGVAEQTRHPVSC